MHLAFQTGHDNALDKPALGEEEKGQTGDNEQHCRCHEKLPLNRVLGTEIVEAQGQGIELVSSQVQNGVHEVAPNDFRMKRSPRQPEPLCSRAE